MTVSVARTILNQLGGSRFIAMTGAKDFVTTDTAISFRIGRNSSKANKVRITLQANDTYVVHFFRQRGLDCDMIDLRSDLYADQLRPVIANYTGMMLSL